MKSQIEALRSIRKTGLPQNRIERPNKGGGYRRRNKWSRWDE